MTLRASAAIAVLLASLVAAPGVSAESRRFAFRTVEGEVVAVGERMGEGDLPVLSVDLAPDGAPDDTLTVLLGPADACKEIGLEVEAGDRVRVRILVDDSGEPVKAQRILNLSRSVMVRLRTMHDVPLWDAGGAWQGAPGRAYRRGVAGAQHGSGGGPGKGPGGPGRR